MGKGTDREIGRREWKNEGTDEEEGKNAEEIAL